jgi:hypothetical protein
MNVNIDGVSFVPVCASANCIGIAITTCNRADVLKMALKQHKAFASRCIGGGYR